MDVIERDGIPLGEVFVIAPGPTRRDAGVKKVGDFVVRDLIVAALRHEHADGAREDRSAVADNVVVDGDVPGPFGLVMGDPMFADADAAGPEVVETYLGSGPGLPGNH